MKRSVLFLTNSYPDFESSHRAVFIKELAHLLKKNGYKICVVTPKIYQESRYFEDQDGVRVYRFPFMARNKLLIEYEKIPYGKMVFYYVSGCLMTMYVILRFRCSLIHVHWAIPTGLIAILAAFLLKIPYVVTVHGSDFRLATEGSKFLRNLFLRVCRSAQQITCVSEVQADGIAKMGVEKSRISTFPMGIDEGFLEARRKRGSDSNGRARTIMSDRNLLPLYNVSLLIRAIPIVLEEEPGSQFLIAGDGPERENLEKKVKDLNVASNVHFLGRIPHEKMPGLLAQADIYVSTSLHDGTSVSLLEAIGAGAFPVVTDIPANREWISDGENGLLVPTDDERALAMCIVQAIRDRSLIEKAAERNRRLAADNILWSRTIEKTENIYGKILSAGS